MSATETLKLRLSARAIPSLASAVCLATIVVSSVALTGLFLVREHGVVSVAGMPLDDAWIHFRIAKNLALGQGFSFNPGEPSSASTSPVWTSLLALGYLISGQFIVPAIVLGTLFYLATNLAVYYLALAIRPDHRLALLAALLCAVTGRWIWASLSGMETTLFTALTVWGLLLYARSRSGRAWGTLPGAALLALAGLVRPEGFLLLVLAIIYSLATSARRSGLSSISQLASGAWKGGALAPILAMLAAIVVRLAYTLGTGGGLAGNTFLAQSLPQGTGPYTGPRLVPDLWYLRSVVDSLRTDDFLLGLLIPLGMVHVARAAIRDRRVRLLATLSLLWFAALPLFNSMIAPNLRHHERYLMPLIPLAVLFGVFGIHFLVEQTLGHRLHLRSFRIAGGAMAIDLFLVLSMVCLGDALIDTRRWATQYAGDVRSIQAVNVTIGEWLRDDTPPGAYIAMNDIGAIAFLSDRRVLDTVGIAEPGILAPLQQRGRAGVFDYIQQKRPDYLVIWPEWYPEMAARTDIFTPVFSAAMDDPLVSTRASMLGGREMVVYKANWPSP